MLYQTCLDFKKKSHFINIYFLFFLSVSVCVGGCFGSPSLSEDSLVGSGVVLLLSVFWLQLDGWLLTFLCFPFKSACEDKKKVSLRVVGIKVLYEDNKARILLNHLTFSWLAQLKDRPWCCFWLFSCVWMIPSFSNWTRHCSGSHGRKLPNQTTHMLSVYHFHLYPSGGF